jgi:septal ring-binding cell division protein DamX
VSAVETPPAAPPPTERRCPRCGATLTDEQEWCLECGAAVGTRIAGPRGWRAPLAIIGVLLALAAIAIVIALVELAGDAEQVREAAATPTPAVTPAAPTTTPAPETGEATAPPEQPSPTAAPGEPEAGRAGGTPPLAEWPEGQTAWTLVLNSSGTREDAERLAAELSAKGVPVGVLDSDDFRSLGQDSFVVFSGQYPTRKAAEDALGTIRAQAGGGSARRIVPNRP